MASSSMWQLRQLRSSSLKRLPRGGWIDLVNVPARFNAVGYLPGDLISSCLAGFADLFLIA